MGTLANAEFVGGSGGTLFGIADSRGLYASAAVQVEIGSNGEAGALSDDIKDVSLVVCLFVGSF